MSLFSHDPQSLVHAVLEHVPGVITHGWRLCLGREHAESRAVHFSEVSVGGRHLLSTQKKTRHVINEQITIQGKTTRPDVYKGVQQASVSF